MREKTAITHDLVFYRSYSRLKENGTKESWQDVIERCCTAFSKLGSLSESDEQMLREVMEDYYCMPSGRALWCLGTPWSEKPENYYGVYNCSSHALDSWQAFAHMFDLGMQGCGTGGDLSSRFINKLPVIHNRIVFSISPMSEKYIKGERLENTQLWFKPEDSTDLITGFGSPDALPDILEVDSMVLKVGDSRLGWVTAYHFLLELSSKLSFKGVFNLEIDLGYIRPTGEKLNGFGGIANPVKVPWMFEQVLKLLNKVATEERRITSEEACLLIDIPALCYVAGNIRRSAGMRQFDADSPLLKLGLWQEDEDGNWSIDPERDPLRAANHTRVFTRKPTLDELKEAVNTQYFSGEGAIQYAPEALARANADLLDQKHLKKEFLRRYTEEGEEAAAGLLEQLFYDKHGHEISYLELHHRMVRWGLNPCGEIIGNNFMCNLSEVHLNNLDPLNFEAQEKAFRAGAIFVAVLLNHEFPYELHKYSRKIDPIVGVSFTGLFDFFTNAFGLPWLNWFQEGRDESDKIVTVTYPKDKGSGKYEMKQLRAEAKFAYNLAERAYLSWWKSVVSDELTKYCWNHGLKLPNRYTTVQPAGSKSLLTGASSGWHPPFGRYWIRRITFGKEDPLALAALDYGYNVIPGQDDKDDDGSLLNDPFDSRCSSWLVEVPCKSAIADIEGAEHIKPREFSAVAQMDFYMNIQQAYTTHNTSATPVMSKDEIDDVAKFIYEAIQQDAGYISVALLSKSDIPFPRLPFEEIDESTFSEEMLKIHSRKNGNMTIKQMLDINLLTSTMEEAGPAGCDSDKCLLPE